MIQFVTLFFGLFTGPHDIALKVTEPVAAVELRLDGHPVATLDAPPWELEVDFGSDLAPRELVAVARDAAGRELDRVRRWVNISAEAAAGEARTAVAVVLEPEVELPAIGEMQSWFVGVEGEPLRVLAAEQGAAEVVVVRDPATQGLLEALGKVQGPDQTAAERQRALRGAYVLGPDTRLRFLSPGAVSPSKTAGARNIFGTSASLPIKKGLLGFLESFSDSGFALRLSDAVAVAGLDLHGEASRRAVVLLVHGDSIDKSLLAPGQVRDYLTRLQVPIFVWSIGAGVPFEAWGGGHDFGDVSKARPRSLIKPMGRYPWGNGELPAPIVAALTDLRQHLDRQRIVYLAGHHLPQNIRLRHGDGIRLAGEATELSAIAASDAVTGRGKGKAR